MIDVKHFMIPEGEYVQLELREVLESDGLHGAAEALANDLGLDNMRANKLAEKIRDVLIGRLSSDELAFELNEDLGIEPQKAIEIGGDLYADFFEEIEDVLDDQHEMYLSNHPEANLPPKPVEEDQHEVVAEQVIRKSGLMIFEDKYYDRLLHIATARLKDVRDEAETKTVLMKPFKTGGLEFNEGKAAKLLLLLNEAVDEAKQKAEQQEKEKVEYAKLEQEALKQRETRLQEIRQEAVQAPVKQTTEGYTADDAKQIYAGTDEERAELKKLAEQFVQGVSDEAELVERFKAQLVVPQEGQERNSLETVASLLVLAKSGLLIKAIKEHPEYRKPIEDHVSKYEEPADMRLFNNHPTDAKFINIFLQLVLIYRAGLTWPESARFGLRIINALKKAGAKEYADLVVFDLNEGLFEWQDPIDVEIQA